MSLSIEKTIPSAYGSLAIVQPMSLGKVIKKRREALGLSQEDLAVRVGVKQPTVQALETGKSTGTKHLGRFARALGVTVETLESEANGTKSNISTGKIGHMPKREPALQEIKLNVVRVVGAVQAGAWKGAVEWPPDEQYELPVALPEQYRDLPVSGLMVRGASMDKVYKAGTILLVVKYIDLGREPTERERVIVQRTRKNEFEASVKTLRKDDAGIPRLWPESNHPDFQMPLRLDRPDDGEEIIITHKVIGSISFEP